MALHRLAATAQQTDRATLLLVCAIAAVLAARANADLACPALPAPAASTGVRLAYLDDAGDDMQPTWQGAARTAATLPLGALAVFSCPPGKELFVGNRSQRTAGSTYNRTCTQLSSQAAAFLPMPPAGIACKPPSSNKTPLLPRCGIGQSPCGAGTCCSQQDTCAPDGLQGQGLCCPKGSEPCGGELCCGAGEACLVMTPGERLAVIYGYTARCCSKGTKPCGKASCCNAGETCFSKLRGGRGLCCPGAGYTPCWPQPWGDDEVKSLTGQPCSCCAPGATCSVPLEQQERDQGDNPEALRTAKCCPRGTTPCGPSACCAPHERCASNAWGDRSCVTRNDTARWNLTACGPSGQPCPPGKCIAATGTCCSTLERPCGDALCCGLFDTCGLPAHPQDQAVCCARSLDQVPVLDPATNRTKCVREGSTPCGTMMCEQGETCGRAPGTADTFRCCPQGTTACGNHSISCCSTSKVCPPVINGRKVLCCRPADIVDCGGMDCCAANTTCAAASRWFSGGCCSASDGSKPCGTTCCVDGFTCVGGKECVRACKAGERACGGDCCKAGSACCGNFCCPTGFMCCDGRACCAASTRCCVDKCCPAGDGCEVMPPAFFGGDGKPHGLCVAGAGCPRGAVACGGRCCAAGQVCSRDGMRCCSPRDVTCLVSGERASVQCGGPEPGLTCGLWDQACILAAGGALGGQPVCCGDGEAACADAAGKCCPAGRLCGTAAFRVRMGTMVQNPTCCRSGTLPCGLECCGEGEWCHGWSWDATDDEGGYEPPRCLPRSYRPCGLTFCPSSHTCFSSARFGQGLCCLPGQRALRGFSRDGSIDWMRCVAA